MTLQVLTKGQRQDRRDLRELITLATEGLPQMFDAQKQLFCDRMLHTEQGPVRKGTSRRYTFITLLGLHQVRVAGLPLPFEIQPVIDALLQDTARLDNLGDLGLLIWLCALASPDRLSDFCSRHALDSAVDRYPDGRERRTMALSWFLSGLSHVAIARPARRGDLTGIAEAVYSILKKNQGPHGIFGHQAQSAGLTGILRGHLGSFADQVYPIYALALSLQAFQFEDALAPASACADAICRAQGPLGQWWWHYDSNIGKVVGKYPVYSVHQHGMAPMALFALGEAAKRDFDREIYQGLEWIYGKNELQSDMRDASARMIWRCIRPAKFMRYLSEAVSLLKPDRDERPPGGMKILHECWPYEFGWLLYAFAKHVRTWPAAG